MGLLQRAILAVVSEKTAATIEAESRAWMLKCTVCETERSVWELGGLRWGASGNPRVRRRCERCSKRQWHDLNRSK